MKNLITFDDYFHEGAQLEIVRSNASYTMISIEDDENVSTIALSHEEVKKLIEALEDTLKVSF